MQENTKVSEVLEVKKLCENSMSRIMQDLVDASGADDFYVSFDIVRKLNGEKIVTTKIELRYQ